MKAGARWRQMPLLALGLWAVGSWPVGFAATVPVSVGDNFFSPPSVTINVNDTITWSWIGSSSHSSTSSGGVWDSGIHGNGFTFSQQFTATGSFPYFCRVHSFQTGSVTVQSANTPPSVTITNPANNAVLSAPANFTIGASASDSGGSVSQVQFFRGTTSLGTDTTSPYSVAASNLAAGTYTLSAVATDNGGAKATNTISIIVNALPTVVITNPVNSATFAAPWTGTIQATATDSDGSVTNVEFFTNSVSLGSVSSPPFSKTVSNVTAGTYTLTARAKDNRGGTNTSAGVTVSVVTPVPVMLSAPQRLSATQFRFSYTANAGLRYTIERSAGVPSGFVAINTNTAAASSVPFTDNTATNGQNFYRVERLPNP